MRINAKFGSRSENGITRCENDPISVDNGKVIRWQSNTDELDDCNAYPISDPISEMFPDNFSDNVISIEDKYHGEVLFAKKQDEEGKIYVLNEKNKNWYVFGNMSFDGFYEAKKGVGIYVGAKMYVFDDTLDYDFDEYDGATSIQAYLKTYPMDFGLPYRTKRLLSASILANPKGEHISIVFDLDNDASYAASAIKMNMHRTKEYSRRLNSERFVRASMTLAPSNDANQRIYRLGVAVKK
jgi:hypothetical protein